MDDATGRLSDLIKHHWNGRNRSYRDFLLAAGLDPRDLRAIATDLQRLPLTDKEFLRRGRAEREKKLGGIGTIPNSTASGVASYNESGGWRRSGYRDNQTRLRCGAVAGEASHVEPARAAAVREVPWA